MKNREAANRSRLKKKNAMTSLEGQVSDLQGQVAQLQQQLAASKAECSALREQNDFLKSLLRMPTDSSDESLKPKPHVSTSMSSGVMVLAIVCAFTFASDWLISSASYASSTPTRGGRVLLSFAEGEEEVWHSTIEGSNQQMGLLLYCLQSVGLHNGLGVVLRLALYAIAIAVALTMRHHLLRQNKQLLPF